MIMSLKQRRIKFKPRIKLNHNRYIPRREASRNISSTVHWPWGDICFSIYQISWRKIKKWKKDLLVHQQHHLVGTLFTNIIYKHFGDFVKCVFTILLQIQHDNNVLPTCYHWQVKVHHFLGICLYECFIYRSNFFFLKMSQSDMPSRLRC